MRVAVYRDPQRLSGYEGEVELIELIGNGLPFALTDGATEKKQILYYLQKWVVEYPDGFRAIRYVRKTLRNRKRSNKNQPHLQPMQKVTLDKFYEVNGKSIY